MDTLRLKPRQPVEDEVENWDDDDFMIEDDITFQSHSASASAKAPSTRRDSLSSLRSDFESIHGEVEEQVHLPGDDEKSTLDAIAAAAKAGIPLPTNVPSSALLGGTIKRLGGRKIKKIIQDDWDDDLVFPESGQVLTIKPQDSSKFPESLRQVSGSSIASSSPSKAGTFSPPGLIQQELLAPKLSAFASPGAINLDQFRDNDEEDDFFGDGGETIKVSKSRPPKPISLITPPTPQKTEEAEKGEDATKDDFETDFDLPSDGTLKLTTRRDIPKTPAANTMDDFDWGEGSLGTRFGGTRREGRSNRSSSASALSPSIASSITAESENEDDGLDCLVLPTGPLNFEERLNLRRRSSRSPERRLEQLEPLAEEPSQLTLQPSKTTPPADGDKEDFLDGLDIGDGEVFDSKKLTLNRHIQLKETRPMSPSRPKTAMSLKFTNKPVVSRLPRPMGSMASHERSQTQSSLEPVSETGGPIAPSRRSLSRLGHSAQSSISSIPTPTTPLSATSSLAPATPRRQQPLGQKGSNVSVRDGPTTTSAQLLRVKRSLPAMRANPSSTRPVNLRNSYDRPPSRSELHARPQSSLRPKTPTERPRTMDSPAAQARKPFLAGGSSLSHNVNAGRTARTFRRHDSENSIDYRPSSRAMSRATMRSPSPRKKIAQEGPWHQLNKPRRLRHFGDGHELDAFDDLPTSTQAEAKFIRQPVASGPRAHIRNKTLQNIMPDRTTTPSPLGPYHAVRHDNVPSFARDTAASRIARETALAQRTPSGGPLAPLTAQRVAQLSTRSNLSPQLPQFTPRSKKQRKKEPSKPQLIANLNPPRESKMVNGMFYNPETFRWEGNDNVLGAFDPPASSPSTASMPPYMLREKENATPRPALITNINATKGVQVVGGMVFDPQNMCWLKLGPQTNATEQSDPMDGFNGIDSDEDVFKDIPDLDDGHAMDDGEGGAQGGRVSDVKDDWLVGEEFDVGPEFVRRQREEEERWRRKCESWVTTSGSRDRIGWRWAIRDIVRD